MAEPPSRDELMRLMHAAWQRASAEGRCCDSCCLPGRLADLVVERLRRDAEVTAWATTYGPPSEDLVSKSVRFDWGWEPKA